MKKLILSIFAGLSLGAFSQTARVQAIHNSAHAAADTVDVFITTPLGSSLLINDFAFRTATPFINAPAGVPISFSIAPKTSTSIADTIAGLTTDFNLANGATYIVVAEGLVSPIGYSTSQPFTLNAFGMGREVAANSGETDVLVVHGSTDAPTVDVDARGVGNLVDDASFGDFAGYLELPTADYTLDVKDATGAVTVASFGAPLSTLSLQDSAIVVLASGFLDPSVNSSGPAFGLWVALANGGDLIPLPAAPAPTARVQVIHNSPDALTDTVDVYLNDALLLDNFAFRTASPFIDAPAENPIRISFAPKTSTSVADTLAGLSFDFNLDANETYVVVAEGLVSTSGYAPLQPFNLNVFTTGREISANSGETDVLVVHGSTDAPTVDVDARGVGNLVDDASFGDFAGYLELPTTDYTLDVKDATGSVTVASYAAPLATLSLQDSAIVVLASGFLDPSVNSSGPAFGLWVALANGGNLIPLPAAPAPTARVQVIHNSPDVLTDTVDVYLNNALLLDNFAFRTASPFIDAPAENPIRISFAPKTSTSVADTLAGLSFDYNLDANETYVIVAEGLVSTSGYTPLQSFNLNVFTTGREMAANSGETDVLVVHGSTDAPTVDVDERTAGNLVNDASFGDFAGYLELTTADYTLDVKDATGAITVASFGAPLSTLSLQDSAIVVLASGFLDPSVNSNGPAFGLWVALANGGDLIPLPSVAGPTTSIEDNQINKFNMFPNPATNIVNIDGLDLSNSNIIITSIDGKTINSNLFTVSNAQINIESLVKGTYFVTVVKENKIIGNASFIRM